MTAEAFAIQDPRVRPRGAARGFTLVEMMVTIGIIVLLAALTISATVVFAVRGEVKQTDTSIQLLGQAVKVWEDQTGRQLSWGDSSQTDKPYANAHENWQVDLRTPQTFSTTEILRSIRRNPQSRDVLAQIPPRFLIEIDSEVEPDERPQWSFAQADDQTTLNADPNHGQVATQFTSGRWDGELAVLDAWGTPIRAIHPGRVADAPAYLENLDNPEPESPGAVRDDANPDPDGTVRTWLERRFGVAKSREVCFVSAGPDRRFGMPYPPENAAEEVAEEMKEYAADNIYLYALEDPENPS